MQKTCLYCDHIFDTNTVMNGKCPVCHELEPKRIQGYTRSKHPLYGKWIRIKDHALVDFDATFNTFYLFTRWFSRNSTNFQDIVQRRDLSKGFTVDNCYIDINYYPGRKRRLFLKLTDQEKASLKTLVNNGHSVAQIAKLFGVSHPTAQNMIEDHKRHEQMAKYA